MRTGSKRAAWLVSGVAAIACGGPTEEAVPAMPEGVVAVYDGGEVAFEELDASVLALGGAGRRELLDGDLDGWKRHVRSLVLDELLSAGARTAGLLDAPELRRLSRGLERRALVEACVAGRTEIGRPSEDDLREIYRRDPSAWERPERRLVRHIFRATVDEEARATATRELEEIRSQVLAGRPFTDFTETSDSEARHREGVLGWFERGQLSEDFDRVVFALEEGVPSRPVRTRTGLHLFYVEAVLPGSSPTLDELRPTLARAWRREARERALTRLESEVGIPDRTFVAADTELRAVIESGSWDAVVLRLDEQTIRLRDVRARAEERSRAVPGEEAPSPEAVLAELRREVVLYRWCADSGEALTAKQRAEVDLARERALREAYRAQLLERELRRHPERLETYHARNRARFGTPLRLRLRRLEVPVTATAAADMQLLESRVGAVRIGARTLEEVAAETGGSIENLGWRTLSQLESTTPKAAWHAADLGEQRVSPPFRVGETLQVLELVERQEPRPLPLDQVRGAVERAYLAEHARELYEQVADDLLADAGYVLDTERLRRFLERPDLTERGPASAD